MVGLRARVQGSDFPQGNRSRKAVDYRSSMRASGLRAEAVRAEDLGV